MSNIELSWGTMSNNKHKWVINLARLRNIDGYKNKSRQLVQNILKYIYNAHNI